MVVSGRDVRTSGQFGRRRLPGAAVARARRGHDSPRQRGDLRDRAGAAGHHHHHGHGRHPYDMPLEHERDEPPGGGSHSNTDDDTDRVLDVARRPHRCRWLRFSTRKYTLHVHAARETVPEVICWFLHSTTIRLVRERRLRIVREGPSERLRLQQRTVLALLLKSTFAATVSAVQSQVQEHMQHRPAVHRSCRQGHELQGRCVIQVAEDLVRRLLVAPSTLAPAVPTLSVQHGAGSVRGLRGGQRRVERLHHALLHAGRGKEREQGDCRQRCQQGRGFANHRHRIHTLLVDREER